VITGARARPCCDPQARRLILRTVLTARASRDGAAQSSKHRAHTQWVRSHRGAEHHVCRLDGASSLALACAALA
jgi:hypothetical protein